jgi:glycosyltransferase involved in cell wall biosynthesis
MIGQKGIPATLGGIERHVQELATRLARREVAVDVYCRPHYTPKGARIAGVDLIRLPSIHTKHLDAISHTAAATLHALFSRADIVHYHALGPSSLAWLPRLGGKRTVVTVHGLDWRREKWGPVAARLLRACEWTATHCADTTVVVSRTLEAHFAASGGRRVEYIPNGTVLPGPASDRYVTAQGLEPGRYLLFVGRLVPEKGLHVLLAAHALAVPERVLVVAGAGHFSDRYVERCRAAANANVRFLGAVLGEDLASLWQHAELVVVPSSLEGLSIALLEAMSYGRPVLASDIPENREVLDEVGESFRAGDAGDLARRLHALVGEPARLAALGAGARARIEAEYDWERVADRTVELYRSLLDGPLTGPQQAPHRSR